MLCFIDDVSPQQKVEKEGRKDKREDEETVDDSRNN
jgi:hypothetical protein